MTTLEYFKALALALHPDLQNHSRYPVIITLHGAISIRSLGGPLSLLFPAAGPRAGRLFSSRVEYHPGVLVLDCPAEPHLKVKGDVCPARPANRELVVRFAEGDACPVDGM